MSSVLRGGAGQLLIVDEPTVGLDPEERVGFRHLLSELGGERVVILSTHIVSDVEAVADRIVVLEGGRVVADGRAAAAPRPRPRVSPSGWARSASSPASARPWSAS